MSSSSFGSNQAASRVVESHSVQSQFSALTRDRDRLRWEVEAADRQRRQQEGRVGELRTMQASLSQQLQAAHAALGTFQKQETLLKQEKARLSTMLSKEREELLDSQTKLQTLLDTQQRSKESFLEEMAEWNDELEQLLTQAQEQEWKRLISSETIAMIPSSNTSVDMSVAKNTWEEAISKKASQEQANKVLLQECEELRARAMMEQVRGCVFCSCSTLLLCIYVYIYIHSLLIYSPLFL